MKSGKRFGPRLAWAAAAGVVVVAIVTTGVGSDALWFLTAKVFGWVFWWCVDVVGDMVGILPR